MMLVFFQCNLLTKPEEKPADLNAVPLSRSPLVAHPKSARVYWEAMAMQHLINTSKRLDRGEAGERTSPPLLQIGACNLTLTAGENEASQFSSWKICVSIIKCLMQFVSWAEKPCCAKSRCLWRLSLTTIAHIRTGFKVWLAKLLFGFSLRAAACKEGQVVSSPNA